MGHLSKGAFADPSSQALRIARLPRRYCWRPAAAQRRAARANTLVIHVAARARTRGLRRDGWAAGPQETDAAGRRARRRPSQTAPCLRAVFRPRFLLRARARARGPRQEAGASRRGRGVHAEVPEEAHEAHGGEDRELDDQTRVQVHDDEGDDATTGGGDERQTSGPRGVRGSSMDATREVLLCGCGSSKAFQLSVFTCSVTRECHRCRARRRASAPCHALRPSPNDGRIPHSVVSRVTTCVTSRVATSHYISNKPQR